MKPALERKVFTFTGCDAFAKQETSWRTDLQMENATGKIRKQMDLPYDTDVP